MAKKFFFLGIKKKKNVAPATNILNVTLIEQF